MLAFGKANVSGSLRLSCTLSRYQSTAAAPGRSNGNGTQQTPVEAATQRELFLNVLNANATKRDAKQYLARFRPPKHVQNERTKLSETHEARNARHRNDQERLDRIGVNLGELYAPARAIADAPQFVQPGVGREASATSQQRVHVALVCLRAPETLDDATLDGVALTLAQLVKLDMRILMVLDCNNQYASADSAGSVRNVRKAFAEQGERVVKALARHSAAGGRLVTGAFEPDEDTKHLNSQKTLVSLPSLLLEPLKRSIIPIVPTLAYTQTGQLVSASASSVMPALSTMLSGLPGKSDSKAAGSIETTLDRIIVLDTAGGIPSKARGGGAHVFINLEQEYDDIENELEDCARDEQRLAGLQSNHYSNLSMLKQCLAVLPSASSALIITPEEAASSSQIATSDEETPGTGTRRQKNTLIHNLLTNKPTVSSSLPVARLPSPHEPEKSTSATPRRATVVKRGMPLTIIPSPHSSQGWSLPEAGTTSLTLEDDPQVDFPRLLHLIEDSFRRKLAVRHYLDRIHGRVAGLIVAGSYAGAAILTYEVPPGADPSNASRLVPYLDKFAVLSSAQGDSGVADILFQAMVRSCFPRGVCWRSRKDNPVNKWYFERAVGTWKIPGSNWSMFWTGDGVVEERERWEDYVGVCKGVEGSWMDGRTPV